MTDQYLTYCKCCIDNYVSSTIELIGRFILVPVKIDVDYWSDSNNESKLTIITTVYRYITIMKHKLMDSFIHST